MSRRLSASCLTLPTLAALMHRGPALLAVALTVVLGVGALTIDVPTATYGIKSDEATYIAHGAEPGVRRRSRLRTA